MNTAYYKLSANGQQFPTERQQTPKTHMLLSYTVQSQIGYESYKYASTDAHPFLRHVLV